MIKLIYIDLFCGGGGTTTGVHKSRIYGEPCAIVAACINHDANAIRSHKSNHKQTLHFTEDITLLYKTSRMDRLVRHIELMKSLYLEAEVVLWASLECTNFSKAKGGQPRDADSRTLAHHLFPYIDMIKPDRIQIENVEEFMSWGELDENGKPISKMSGVDYLKWVNDVKSRGYNFEHRILNSADFGAYTSRKRFFGQFARVHEEIFWPIQTHAESPTNDLWGRNLKKWMSVKHVLDLSDEGESIFDRKKPLVDATLERIYAGLIKFVAGGKKAFLSRYNSVNPKHTVVSLDGPCGTLTTNNMFAIVNTRFISAYHGNGDNVSDIDKPSPTITTKDRLSLVQTRFIDQQYGQSKPASIDRPLGCITTNPKYAPVTVKPWIMSTNFGNIWSSIEIPAPVITANRKWHYLMNPQFNSDGWSVDRPCFTLIARMDKRPPSLVNVMSDCKRLPSFVKNTNNGLVIEIYETDSDVVKKIKYFMAIYGIIDIMMRTLRIPELKKIMGFPEDYTLIGTQAEQKKFIGNAVEVNMATALVEATALGKI